jgi:hypothetical protein
VADFDWGIRVHLDHARGLLDFSLIIGLRLARTLSVSDLL